MEKHFTKFFKNITLTSLQKKDAKTKYEGVVTLLHDSFYESEYNGDSKYLFGSYKNKTAIRPMSIEQDVDVLFKIPEDIYKKYKGQEGGQSNLLTKIKEILKTKYTTTDTIKNWGKVVLIQFKNNTHNVEVLPAYEKENGVFIIPNTEDGGSWDEFDPRSEIEKFQTSSQNTNSLTRDLIKAIKRWKRENVTLELKSYKINDFVINFLEDYTFLSYPDLIADFFKCLNKDEDLASTFTKTAKNRAIKALDYFTNDKTEDSIEEYRKIFGGGFPKTIKENSFTKSINHLSFAPNEEFIDDLYLIEINPDISFELEGKLNNVNGFSRSFSEMPFLPKQKDIIVKIKNLRGVSSNNISILWKVRNKGEEAKKLGQLRGDIVMGNFFLKEYTSYTGSHFIECYLIMDNKCVSRKKIEIIIK